METRPKVHDLNGLGIACGDRTPRQRHNNYYNRNIATGDEHSNSRQKTSAPFPVPVSVPPRRRRSSPTAFAIGRGSWRRHMLRLGWRVLLRLRRGCVNLLNHHGVSELSLCWCWRIAATIHEVFGARRTACQHHKQVDQYLKNHLRHPLQRNSLRDGHRRTQTNGNLSEVEVTKRVGLSRHH